MNQAKRKLLAGEIALGFPVFEFATPGIGRILDAAGADFAMFDMEHAGFGIDTIRAVVSYCRGTSVSPFVRVPTNRREYISPVLDAGAQGVMVPMVESLAGARAMVEAARYAPEGSRGVAHGIAHDDFLPGDSADKLIEGNREVLTIAMIETAVGLENADEIASCPGLDAVWIGHFDLAASLGIPGQIDSPIMLEAFDTVAAAARRNRKVAGRGVMTVAAALEWMERGFSAFTYSRDIVLVRDTLGSQLREIRERALGARELQEIAQLRRRLLAARDDFRAIPSGGENRLGPPNPATGEAWSRGHVLGHMADILAFWSGQLRLALEGQSWIGRGDAGYASRRAAILEGVSGDEAALRDRIGKGVDQVLVLLDSVRPEDLGRTVEHRRSVETRVKTIGHLLDEVLVGHFEAHVKQLAELS